VLSRQLLRRGEFHSTADLTERIQKFIELNRSAVVSVFVRAAQDGASFS
jgi:hypothetical protein